jgi:Potassium-transporting ATPase A subunit
LNLTIEIGFVLSFPLAPFFSDFARSNDCDSLIRSRLVYELVTRRLSFIQHARRIVPIVKDVCQSVNHNAGFEHACRRVGCASNSGSPNLRVTVVRTTAEATIAARRYFYLRFAPLVGTIVIIGALLFLPVAALGPLAEHWGLLPFGG